MLPPGRESYTLFITDDKQKENKREAPRGFAEKRETGSGRALEESSDAGG
jgi:hypothetical protein